MIGQTLGRYRILERLGAGGMGEVYRAHDERLDREVAIKVLPPDALADDQARRRFQKEAKALSKFNHPHIATIHDFDTQQGVDFIVMELVTGEPLDDKLKAGPLPEKDIARLGEQMASALEEAHEHGIIHRDLKPGNIRLTSKGQVKILDFGIARLLQPAGVEATTQSFAETQTLVGTLPYMSPEQLRGGEIDARSDVYSFGAMLYEMATGQRPFQQKLSTALSDAILHDPVPVPRTRNARLSPALENIILKCLEKGPDNRYQSAKELVVDLRRLASSPPLLGMVPTRRRLAVLPLENLTGDPEQDYFSDGMTEEMIAQLGRMQPERLGVIARTSAMQYKHTKKAIDQIARELGVDYILEGSVRRAGERVRITAQLVQVRDQTHMWAESYERGLADIFAIQSDVAERVALSLALKLMPAEQARLARARPVNPQAHEAYLKGRYHWNKRTENGMRKAIECFQQALDIDPGHGLAYAGLADSYLIQGAYGFVTGREVFPKAKAAAMKALELDDMLGEAHASLGLLLFQFNWDAAAGEKELQRAIELNPNYATAHHWYGFLLLRTGQSDKGLAQMKQAQELDPLSLIISSELGFSLYFARQYDQAIAHYRRNVEMDPNFWPTRLYLGWAYEQKRAFAEAIAELQKALQLSSGFPRVLASLGHAYAEAGRSSETESVLEELQQLSRRVYVPPYDVAAIYAGLREKDQAFSWLQKGYEEHDGWMVFLREDPRFDPLRGDPRFHSLLRRLNFPE